MNDWAKYLIGIGAGYAAALIYKNYQAEQALEAARLARSRQSTAGKITELAVQGARDVGLVPASNMQGLHGHMPMSQAGGFYGQGGMRQSAPGNPHAPVVVPRRQAPQAPPPPPPPPPAEGEAHEEFENYSDDNMMGGQRF